MSHFSRLPSDVSTNAPLRVPTSSRTLLIPHSLQNFSHPCRVSVIILSDSVPRFQAISTRVASVADRRDWPTAEDIDRDPRARPAMQVSELLTVVEFSMSRHEVGQD